MDGAGNQDACSFTVHVNGAVEQIRNLITWTQSQRVQAGTSHSLIVKLQGAALALDRGNIRAARGHLDAFLNEVNAQKGKKLTIAQADSLNVDGIRIAAVIVHAKLNDPEKTIALAIPH
jgi:hypothetical protein